MELVSRSMLIIDACISIMSVVFVFISKSFFTSSTTFCYTNPISLDPRNRNAPKKLK